jgi:hypothetical protein
MAACRKMQEKFPSDFFYAAKNFLLTATAWTRSRILIISYFLLLLLPAVAQAQFTYSTNSGAVTVVSFTGSGAVTISNTIGIYPVTAIGMNAFIDQSGVTSVAFDANLKSIGYQAFGYCSGLTSLTIPDTVTNIGQYAFEPCTGLTNVALPAHLGTIQSETFGDCSSLVSITIPASVTNIASAAFDNCSSLASIYFLGNAPTAGANIFHGVNGSAKVYYLAGASGWGSTYGGLPTVMLASTFQIISAGVQNNNFEFTFTGTNSQTVIVQACTNLVNPNWLSLVTNMLSGTSSNFTDAQWKNFSRRFYRLYSP